MGGWFFSLSLLFFNGRFTDTHSRFQTRNSTRLVFSLFFIFIFTILYPPTFKKETGGWCVLGVNKRGAAAGPPPVVGFLLQNRRTRTVFFFFVFFFVLASLSISDEWRMIRNRMTCSQWQCLELNHSVLNQKGWFLLLIEFPAAHFRLPAANHSFKGRISVKKLDVNCFSTDDKE